jgi:hypothetical protein
MDDVDVDDSNPFRPPAAQPSGPLGYRTGCRVYILGLCTIWGDRFFHSGFRLPRLLDRVALFFVGVPLVCGFLVGITMFLVRRQAGVKCLFRGLVWSFTVFGALLICLTAAFWIERLVNVWQR